MGIHLKSFMPIGNPGEYKIHFAVYNGEEEPLDIFTRDPDEWKGWNSWRGKRDDFNRRFIFGLIRYYHQPNRWLFGGIFEVVERGATSNKVELVDLYREFIGRLLLDHPGPGLQGRAFRFENYIENLKVAQILESPYEGEAFCGYENIEHGFARLEPIFVRNKLDWKSALENVKGVYLITDRCNGKMYVGSAYGDTGIWSRWACYIGTGHGGNDEFTKLINEKGIDYARTNFQFSLLEFRSMRTDDQAVIDREQYWKRVLQTEQHGYNKN